MNKFLKNKISKIVIGTVQFGMDYGINNNEGKVSEEEVTQIFDIARNRHIETLDTAYVYGNSEEVLGRVGVSSDFKIVSKYPKCNEPVDVMFNKSLSRLRADSLYAYMAHDFDTVFLNLSKWKEFEKLKETGKVSKIGFSLYNIKQLQLLWDNNIRFDILQFPYNILDRQFEPFFKKLKEQNVEIHTRSIFLQGLFFKNTEELSQGLSVLKPYLQKIQDYCKESNIAMEHLAMNYVLSKTEIDGVLIGIDSVKQLQSNIDKLGYAITDKDIDFINSVVVTEKEILNPVNWKK